LMKKPAPTLDMDFTVKEMTGVIKCLDLIIGMRLHALILAAILCVPLVGLSYDPKIGRFLNQLGVNPAAEVENLDFIKLNEAVDKVLSDPEEFKRKLEERIKPLQDLSYQSAILTLGIISPED
jgi:polysaccharide pyruvyl transferase WcaK-like protein